jgi:DNA modification methylase
MTPYYETPDATIILGDCREVMAAMESNSVDAIVTDPPAGISFMGKTWDHDKGGRDQWVAWLAEVMREAFRVAKPGAHAVVWALPRTSGWTHRALEDAGWEVRDCITHLFATGFPKSMSISKAFDKAAGAEREVVGQLNNKGRVKAEGWGMRDGGFDPITAPATDLAKQWAGWGSALKPAAEFWYLARKPLIGTLCANVAAYGTGGLNIDASRIKLDGEQPPTGSGDRRHGAIYAQDEWTRTQMANGGNTTHALGRWPANVVLGCCGNEPHDAGACLSPAAWSNAVAHAPTLTRLLGYPGGCPSCLRFCDERIHSAGGDAQACVPSLLDALAAVRSELQELVHNLPSQSESSPCGSDDSLRRSSELCTPSNKNDEYRVCRMLFDTPDKSSARACEAPENSTRACSISAVGPHETSFHNECIAGVVHLLDLACADLASGISFTPIIPGFCPVAVLDAQSGERKSGKYAGRLTPANRAGTYSGFDMCSGKVNAPNNYGDTGGASRFFYVAKASRRERNAGLEGMPMGANRVNAPRASENEKFTTLKQNFHPTVKPLALMAHLVKLVTPPGGLILDPFAGSGSTGVAAVREGFRFVGIEQSEEYAEIAAKRLQQAVMAFDRQPELALVTTP